MELSVMMAPKPQNHELVQIFAVAGEIVTYVVYKFLGSLENLATFETFSKKTHNSNAQPFKKV
jgi:hypothetical protein